MSSRGGIEMTGRGGLSYRNWKRMLTRCTGITMMHSGTYWRFGEFRAFC